MRQQRIRRRPRPQQCHGPAGTGVQRLDEGHGGRSQFQVSQLGLELEGPDVADIRGVNDLFLECVGFDEVAEGMVAVVVVAENDQLLETLLHSALFEVDLAETETIVGGREGAVAVKEGANRVGNVPEDQPTIIGQRADVRLDQGLEILAVGRQRETRSGNQTDQHAGREDRCNSIFHSSGLSFKKTLLPPGQVITRELWEAVAGSGPAT